MITMATTVTISTGGACATSAPLKPNATVTVSVRATPMRNGIARAGKMTAASATGRMRTGSR